MSDKIDYVKLEMDSAVVGSLPLVSRNLKSFWRISALCLVIAGAPANLPAEQACTGDADRDGAVRIAELIQAVGNALEGCEEIPGTCNGDANCDGVVAINELILAVGYALDGCPLARAVSVAWLVQALERDDVQVVDARVGAFPGGHIPGALPLSPYTLAETVEGIDFQIIGAETAASVIGAIGLHVGSVAVVYGAAPEFDPARVVWALEYLGHPDVRYLDGGFAAWQAAGAEIAPGDPIASGTTDYPVEVNDDLRVTGAWILDQLGDPPYAGSAIQIVDARSPAEYAMGFIPTAVHRQWTINLDGGLLLPRSDLERLYADLDKTRTTVVYCLAGWRASVAWMVLSGLGFEDVRVYDGSWLEWGNGEFPVHVPPALGNVAVSADF